MAEIHISKGRSSCHGTSSNLYYSVHFPYRDGFLYCENKRVDHIKTWLEEENVIPSSPFFVYSKAQIVSNVNSYLDPMKKLHRHTVLNYALKANMNVTLVKLMKDLGCSLTLVSGLELQLALKLGFAPENLVFNGNGKQIWEIELAVRNGCLLNIDSLFNLQQTQDVCRRLDQRVRVLLRINPDLNPNVHHYISTGKGESKFGIRLDDIHTFVDKIKGDPHLLLVGLHSHIGSTIVEIDVIRASVNVILKLYQQLKREGFDKMQYINIGGGLGISYTKHAKKTRFPSIENMQAQPSIQVPTPAQVVDAIEEIIKDDELTVILEPGRSLIGDAAILVTTALGVKSGLDKQYIVVDGSMTEVLRPALYGAYHHIDLAEPTKIEEERLVNQVVGPVCESGDFLGHDRYLATPHVGCCLAVFDVGAYCASMASNYNMRPRPAEVLVDGEQCELIRTPDTFHTIIAPYNQKNIVLV